MKNIKFILAAILLFTVSATYAQFSNTTSNEIENWEGVRVSYSSYTLDIENDIDADIDPISKLSIGYIKSFSISKDIPLYIETGANASWSFGDLFDEFGVNISATMLTLDVPVNFGYKYNINDQVSIFPYIGATFKYHLQGELELEYNGDSETTDMFDEDEGDGNRFQYGLQIGATLGYEKFNFGISYGFDLNKLADDTKTKNLSFTIGYNF